MFNLGSVGISATSLCSNLLLGGEVTAHRRCWQGESEKILGQLLASVAFLAKHRSKARSGILSEQGFHRNDLLIDDLRIFFFALCESVRLTQGMHDMRLFKKTYTFSDLL
ncbi:hypothetical protein FP2506_05551 [Fulvimarina pelagi HTCC2506]|uniref:Uncharacterized protein n=1 Tax=Fulvimarina pelagi HTCC2506 TaxID=314231 RepID=Q0G7T6_9HYPH|nr:hypothetical protein FP2506_05551 [Fulvimarina pelagi HTCC2506]